MAHFDGSADDELAVAAIFWAILALVHVADVGGERPGEVAAGGHVAQVVVELVGAADHILSAFEGAVDNHGEAFAERLRVVLEPDGTEIAGRTVEELLQLFGLHGAQLGRTKSAEELGLVHLVIAAEKCCHAVPGIFAAAVFRCHPMLERHVGHALDVGSRRHLEE